MEDMDLQVEFIPGDDITCGRNSRIERLGKQQRLGSRMEI